MGNSAGWKPNSNAWFPGGEAKTIGAIDLEGDGQPAIVAMRSGYCLQGSLSRAESAVFIYFERVGAGL
jgi:hypothetical protein